MKYIECTACGRSAKIDDPEGWVCLCKMQKLENQLSTLSEHISTHQADITATLQQKARLLPAVDRLLALRERQPQALPADFNEALQKLLHARQTTT